MSYSGDRHLQMANQESRCRLFGETLVVIDPNPQQLLRILRFRLIQQPTKKNPVTANVAVRHGRQGGQPG